MQVVLVYLQYISANIHSKCASQPKIAKKKSPKTHIFGVQGRSRSSMSVPPESSTAVLVMIHSKSVSICNRFHATWANSGKITISNGGYTSSMPSFEGNLFTQWHQITSYETRDSRLSYGEDPESISPGLQSVPGRDGQTDGQTDRQNSHS